VNDELKDLYQEIIIEHSKRPRNYRPQESARSAHGYNPLCGDQVEIFVKMNDGLVEDVSFQGSGCAISTASASVMTEALKGKTEAEAEELFGHFHDLVTSGEESDDLDLGKLAVFGGVSEFPARVKCATLCWHTLKAAIAGQDEPVTTE